MLKKFIRSGSVQSFKIGKSKKKYSKKRNYKSKSLKGGAAAPSAANNSGNNSDSKKKTGFCISISSPDEVVNAEHFKKPKDNEKLTNLLNYLIENNSGTEVESDSQDQLVEDDVGLLNSEGGLQENLVLLHISKKGVKINPILKLADGHNIEFLTKRPHGMFYGIGLSIGTGSVGKVVGKAGFEYEKQLVSNWNEGGTDPTSSEIKRILGGKYDDAKAKWEDKPSKRPILFDLNRQILSLDNGSDGGGKKISDVTLINLNGEEVYISAKDTGRVTFVNSGITPRLKMDFINHLFKNMPKVKKEQQFFREGLLILEYFGIDKDTFCEVFNFFNQFQSKKNSSGVIKKESLTVPDDIARFEEIKTVKPFNPSLANFNNFISDAIGNNYILVHSGHVEPVDARFKSLCMVKHVKDIKIFYGGKKADSLSKRIDIEITTTKFDFILNIRNKSGKVYPSHLMLDYKIKK